MINALPKIFLISCSLYLFQSLLKRNYYINVVSLGKPPTKRADRSLPALFIILSRLSVVEGILSGITDILVINDLLGRADEEESSGLDGSEEFSEYFILGFIGKVDKNVSAYDHVVIGIILIL